MSVLYDKYYSALSVEGDNTMNNDIFVNLFTQLFPFWADYNTTDIPNKIFEVSYTSYINT